MKKALWLTIGVVVALGAALAGATVWLSSDPVLRSGFPNLFVWPRGAVSPADYVELTRTACFGACPAYTVRIDGAGQVSWIGRTWVAVQGDANAHVDPAVARSLIDQFRNRRFWLLWKHYRRLKTDMPTYCSTVSIHGDTRTVSDYADAAPEWLRVLDIQIDALADTHRWRHGDPSHETFDGGYGGITVAGGIWDERDLPKPGVTELMQAAANGNEETASVAVMKLIRAGADVNAADVSGWTPLMYAARVGTLASMQELLRAGARADARSKAGETAMDAADSERDYHDRAGKVAALKAALYDQEPGRRISFLISRQPSRVQSHR